jgi:hypothetical protein
VKKLTIAFAHYATWRWTAIAVHALKTFKFPLEHEIIVVNNSPHDQSIRCLTDTPLGEGVRIIPGDPTIPSHGQALSLAYEASDSDWIFTSESDALPIQDSWGNEYVKAAANFDYIGPWMALAGGKFIHPCGAMAHRKVIEAAKEWRKKHSDWVFATGCAPELGLSDKGYHVSCTKEFLESQSPSQAIRDDVELWKKAGPWQEMLSFDDDSFDNYWMRENIQNLEPVGKQAHLRIGYEPGQHLSAFAIKHFKCLMAPYEMKWIPGFHNRQAAYSDVFGGFRHVWCGTSSFSPAIDPAVRAFKMNQMDLYFSQIPADIRSYILELERQNS